MIVVRNLMELNQKIQNKLNELINLGCFNFYLFEFVAVNRSLKVRFFGKVNQTLNFRNIRVF